MWQNHALTPPFQKPYHEFTPCQQTTQYFDILRDVREEAIHFKSAQRKVRFHDSIPRYKWDKGFLNYGKGWGCDTLSQEDKTTTILVGSVPEATTDQFTEAHQEISKVAPAAITMPSLKGIPPLEDAESLEGAVAPDPGTYEPAGNKFTRSHSPRTEDDDSDDPPTSS